MNKELIRTLNRNKGRAISLWYYHCVSIYRRREIEEDSSKIGGFILRKIMMFCTKYLDRKFEPLYICIYIYIVLVEAGLPSSIKSTVPSVTVWCERSKLKQIPIKLFNSIISEEGNMSYLIANANDLLELIKENQIYFDKWLRQTVKFRKQAPQTRNTRNPPNISLKN